MKSNGDPFYRPGAVFVLAVIAFGVANAAEPVLLFDGKTLAGWRGVNGAMTHWEARDGVLAWKGGPGARWIATDKMFADFVLDLEFNYAPGANGGVFFRAPTTTGRPAYEGNEIQIVDEAAPVFAEKMTEDRRMGALYTVQPPAGHVKAPPNQWHRLTISCVGSHLKVTLNGEIVIDTQLDTYPAAITKEHPGLFRTKGHIGLQSKPDSQIKFRNITVKVASASSR